MAPIPVPSSLASGFLFFRDHDHVKLLLVCSLVSMSFLQQNVSPLSPASCSVPCIWKSPRRASREAQSREGCGACPGLIVVLPLTPPAWSLTPTPTCSPLWEGGTKYKGTICLTAGVGRGANQVPCVPQRWHVQEGKGIPPRTQIKSSGGKRCKESDSFPDLGGEPCPLGVRRGFYMAQKVSFPQNKI